MHYKSLMPGIFVGTLLVFSISLAQEKFFMKSSQNNPLCGRR